MYPSHQSQTALTTAVESPTPETSPDALDTPTLTHYQQLADQVSREIDAIAAIIPKLEMEHAATARFVRSYVNIPIEFLATTVAAVDQTPELQGFKKLDVAAGRDTLQFIEAFRPILDKVLAFAASLKFTMLSRKSTLAADALQTYAIAKGVARDPGSAHVAMLVLNMKRDLGRRGPRSSRSKPQKEVAA